jgi:hypothetical protein
MGNGLIGFLKVLRAGQLGADEAIKADAFFGGFDRAGLFSQLIRGQSYSLRTNPWKITRNE